jgi:hypothetical protein
MNHQHPHPCWIFLWRDESGDIDHHIRETADSAEEARDVIHPILTGVTWTPEDADECGGDETEPAYAALVREMFSRDIIAGLLRLNGDGVTISCDGGIWQRSGNGNEHWFAPQPNRHSCWCYGACDLRGHSAHKGTAHRLPAVKRRASRRRLLSNIRPCPWWGPALPGILCESGKFRPVEKPRARRRAL